MKMKKQKRLIYFLKHKWDSLLIKLFVDNIFLHKFVACHRLSSRSFFVRNRQFHICARYTGLITGCAMSVLLIPCQRYVAPLFLSFIFLLTLDGLTQLFGWRRSNNTLRLITGLGTGSTVLPFVISLWNF